VEDAQQVEHAPVGQDDFDAQHELARGAVTQERWSHRRWSKDCLPAWPSLGGEAQGKVRAGDADGALNSPNTTPRLCRWRSVIDVEYCECRFIASKVEQYLAIEGHLSSDESGVAFPVVPPGVRVSLQMDKIAAFPPLFAASASTVCNRDISRAHS